MRRAGLVRDRTGWSRAPASAPIGLWLSSSALDLAGPGSARAADRLLGLGILAAAPASPTGLADWQGAGQRTQRVGAVHAALNAAALVGYGTSWILRRGGTAGWASPRAVLPPPS